MRFELGDPLDVAQFRAKSELLIKRGATIDVIEKKQPKTDNQARYAHLLINYFAYMVQKPSDYVKRMYFKYHCNRDIFLVNVFDDILNIEATMLRSTNEISKTELSTAITKFRVWSQLEHGIYLPTPEEKELLLICESKITKSRQYEK